MYSATWVGGEPLLRKDLIEQGMKYFTHNLVVTNGSIEFPNWEDVYFHVSIDGDEASHDETRGVKGLYQKIKNNINNIENQKVVAAMCITNLNKHSIGTVLNDFKDSKIEGFMFDFYTPMIGEKEKDPLFIEPVKRDEIIEKLIEYKKGEFSKLIKLPVEVLKYMKSDNMGKVLKNCSFRESGLALNSGGQVKEKCVIGKNADCLTCGCVVPYYLHLRKDKKHILSEIKNEVKQRYL
jgi:Fe-coproporphyrin III synthase